MAEEIDKETIIFANPLSYLSVAGWIGIGLGGATIGYIAGDALWNSGRLGAIVGFFGMMLFIYLMTSLSKIKK